MGRIISTLLVLVIGVISVSPKAPPDPPPEPVPIMEAINRADYWDADYKRQLAEAKLLTDLANSIVPDGDVYCKLAIMQCIINRSNAVGFPDTVEAVCAQRSQWPIKVASTGGSTATARELLAKYSSGEVFILEIPCNCVFFDVLEDGLSFKPALDSTDTTFIPFRRTT